jgi:hypothetical protein
MADEAFPVEWAGRRAVVTLPEHINVSNVAQLREQLLSVINRGAALPVEISLSPVPTATGHFILAVIRDATEARRREDLADLARAAVAEQTHQDQELLDRVVHGLFQVGLSLQAAVNLPNEVARERITEALRQLDDTIHEIRDYAFFAPGPGTAA